MGFKKQYNWDVSIFYLWDNESKEWETLNRHPSEDNVAGIRLLVLENDTQVLIMTKYDTTTGVIPKVPECTPLMGLLQTLNK